MRSFTAIAVVGLALTGCGTSERDRRIDAVNDFIRAANVVQTGQARAFDRANRAYVIFSQGKLGAADARRELLRAEQAMRSTRDQVARLAAPPQARELQRRLVALFDANAALAHESTLLASFIPAQIEAARPLVQIGHQMTRRLRSARGPAGQARALRLYAARVHSVIRRLEPLKPPPLLLARHNAQVERLRTVRRLALRLASALGVQDRRRVARLLLRFRRVNTESKDAAYSRVALREYRRRYLAVREKTKLVQAEARRVQGSLVG